MTRESDWMGKDSKARGPEVLDQEDSLWLPGQFLPQLGSVDREKTSLLGQGPEFTILWVEAPGRQVLEVPRKHLFMVRAG